MSSAYDLAQQAQRLAADPATNVFVTANAGSGKTKVLIDRIARLLLAGAQPSSFLCITYTKAAAAEMQRRLFERLGEWCVASDENLQAALQELEAPEGALPRARALFARALETPGGLRIQTIHAFCERLLARFPLEADAPPGFDIADEARAAALMNKARARLLSADDVQAAEAFTRFATKLDAGRLDALIGKLVEQAVLFAGMDGETIAARHRARGAAEAIIADALASAPWADWTTAAGTLAASTPANQKCGALIMAAHALREGEAAAAWAGYSAIFLTQDGKPRAKPITDAIRKAEPFLDRLFEEAGAAFHEACAAVRAAERAADAAAALTLGRTLAEAYAAAKAQAGVLDFADLIAQARALLTKSGAAAWVLYKLDGRIDHILVDEGQDTSPDQWALVAPLQEEFFAGAGGVTRERTVFAVGDPKQSIYSFQGAEPARFREEGRALDLRAHAAGRAFSAPSLDMSFRSTAQVLQAVDAAFEGLEIVDAAPEAFDVMRHTVRREGETGLVEAWPIAPRPQARAAAPWDAPLDMEQAEAAHVVLAREIARTVKRWIVEGHAVWDKGALRPMRAGDVLALVRARGPVFQALIKAFKREGLPVAGADRMVLRDELAVEDCLALMRVALDPGDDLSLACVLKGPWLNLVDDDRDLFPLAHGRAKGERLLDRLMAQRDARYTRARAFVSDLIARAGLDAFAFLSWALETPDEDGRSGWARVFARLGQEARDPLAELLERALHPGREAAPTLQRFLADIEGDAVDVKREMEEAGQAVRVMTVHAAKGLEAPVVILPDTTGPAKQTAENGLIIDKSGLYWSPSEKEDDAATAEARAAHKARARSEHLRLLYVAMTRARDRLIVCGFGRGRGEGAAADESWHARVFETLAKIGAPMETPFGEGYRLGQPLFAAVPPEAGHEQMNAPAWARARHGAAPAAPRAAPSRLKPADPATLSPRRAGGARFRRGKLIHGLLQRLPELEAARRPAAAEAWLKRQGVSEEEAAALAREALGVLNAPGLAAAFGPGSRAEAPLAGRAAGLDVRGVVDRLVVTAAEAMIIDFKSDRPAPLRAEDAPAGYVLQMALYRALIAQIFPDRPVRCAIIWTERPHLTELSPKQLESALAAFARG